MKLFGMVAIAAALFLMVMSPLWGHVASILMEKYELSFIVGMYVAVAPWLLYIGSLGVWIMYKIYKET